MKNKINSSLLLFAILLSLIPAAMPTSTVQAQSGDLVHVEIQPDSSTGKDSYITNTDIGTGYMTSNVIGVGENNTLTDAYYAGVFDFDLSGLPYDFFVDSASLVLTVQADFADNAGTINAYLINTPWATCGHVSWNEKDCTTQWQTWGALGENDVVLDEPIGSVLVDNDLVEGEQVTINLTTNEIMHIRYGNYYGILLRMETQVDDLYFFYSSNDSTEENRPKLILDYYTENPMEDPGWVCWDGVSGSGSSNFSQCLPETIETEPMMPFQYASTTTDSAWGVGRGLTAAQIQCDPYPRCINDFLLHYRLVYDMNWSTPYLGDTDLVLWLDIPGGEDQPLGTIYCGRGSHIGRCTGVIEGIIFPSELPVDYDGGYTVGVYAAANHFISVVTTKSLDFDFYIGRIPFDENCSDTYYTPLPETFEIDPTLEFPLGPTGTPADVQIYPTEIGQLYMARVVGEPWNNGESEELNDTEVSFDGETWISWVNFTGMVECLQRDPLYVEQGAGYLIVYFIATTENFYIRVDDEPDEYADNFTTHNETLGETPFAYIIGEAFLISEEACDSAFSWTPAEDLLAEATVDGDSTGVIANFSAEQHMQVGEWYAIEVEEGTTWNEPEEEGRIDMDFQFTGIPIGAVLYPDEYTDLAEGSQYVWCVGENVAFVQAPAEIIGLRVNDQDDDFSNNSGSLEVNIYHVGFDRPSETCELSFALDQLVRSDSVDAKQENGKVFALTVGSALVNNNTQNENFLSGGLVPGAWYALETTGGPWGSLGEGVAPANTLYSLAVAQSSPGNTAGPPAEDAWGSLSEWDFAECVVETDALGHLLVYFQLPVTGAASWSLRVNDFDDWNRNSGSMSWNLYRVIDLGPTDSGICDYSFDPETKLNGTAQTVNSTAIDGAYITTGAIPGEPVGSTGQLLLPNTTYAIELLGENFQWFEENGDGLPRTDMELSLNNGSTWGDLPEYGALCSVEDGENLIFFLRSGNESPRFKLRVNSTSFDNNVGFMGYNIYAAEAGSSINPYDGCVTEGYSTTSLGMNNVWIPVHDEQGIGLGTTSSGYAEFNGLVPGNRYLVEIANGPWYDAENDIGKYTAQVSSDGGVTWHPMNGNNPDITCWELSPNFTYAKIEFTVQEGQVWRIRVADTDSETFADNTGNLAFRLSGLVQPQDTTVTGTFTLAGCNTPPIFPGLLSVSELLNLGNYLAEWFDYVVGSIVSFLAWCPENTAAVTLFAEDINTKEPFAMFEEINGILNDVKNELNGYNWGSSGEDYSILNRSPAQSAQMIEEYIFGPIPDDSPWMGGDLVDLSTAPAPTMFFDNCQLALVDYVGPLLGKGVCFSSNWAQQVGLIFWVQLMFDVSVAFACIGSVFATFKQLIYLLTGVNFSTPQTAVSTSINVIVDDAKGRRR